MTKHKKNGKNGNGITPLKVTEPQATKEYLKTNPNLREINKNLGGTKEKPNSRLLRLIGAIVQLRTEGRVKGIGTDLQFSSDRDVNLALRASKSGSHVLTAAAFLLRSTPKLTADMIKKSLERKPEDRGFAEAVERTVRGTAYLLNRDKQLFDGFNFTDMNWNDRDHPKFKNFEDRQNQINLASGELIKDIHETYMTDPAAVHLYLLEKVERLKYYQKIFDDHKTFSAEKGKTKLSEDEFFEELHKTFYREVFQHQYFLNRIYDALEMPEAMKDSNDIPFVEVGDYKLLKGGSESRKEYMPREDDVRLRKQDYLEEYEKTISEGRKKAEEIHAIMIELFTTEDGRRHLRKYSPKLSELSYEPSQLSTKGILSYAIKKYVETIHPTSTGIHDIFRSRLIVNNPQGIRGRSQALIKAMDMWLIKRTNGEYALRRKNPKEFLEKHKNNLEGDVEAILRDKKYFRELDIKDRFKIQDEKARGRKEIIYVASPTDSATRLPEIEGQIHHRKDYLRVSMRELPHFKMRTNLLGTAALGILVNLKTGTRSFVNILTRLNERHRKMIIENPFHNGIDKTYGIKTGK